MTLASTPIKLIIHHNEQTAEVMARTLTSGQVADYRRRLTEVNPDLGNPDSFIMLSEQENDKIRAIMEDAIQVSTGLTKDLLPDVDAIKSAIFEEIILISSVSEKDLAELSKFRRQ